MRTRLTVIPPLRAPSPAHAHLQGLHLKRCLTSQGPWHLDRFQYWGPCRNASAGWHRARANQANCHQPFVLITLRTHASREASLHRHAHLDSTVTHQSQSLRFGHLPVPALGPVHLPADSLTPQGAGATEQGAPLSPGTMHPAGTAGPPTIRTCAPNACCITSQLMATEAKGAP